MTAIAGVVHKNHVYMGGDSLGGSHGAIFTTVRKDPKVFQVGPYLIGFTDSYRMGQILRFHLQPPKPTKQDAYDHMVKQFVPAVRKCLKANGWMGYHGGGEREVGGDFLVGYKGRLFVVYGDFQVAEAEDQYNALGCGEQLVKGSLHATEGNADLSPEDRILKALEAAERHSGGVQGPFTILKGK